MKIDRKGCVLLARQYSQRAKTVSIQSSIQVPPNSRVFSLVQPTGKIHLGNYLGALRNWKEISNSDSPGTEFIFGTADLHSITIPYDPKELKQFRYEAIAGILSSGIDASKCTVYHQSSVPEHCELNWILTCLTSMGALNRMTQWKLKTKIEQNDTIFDDEIMGKTKAGLLCYPILQAADILLYKSTHVPVGDDQSQPLELCRDIANTFNNRFQSGFFPLPQTLLTPAKKILALRNPVKKMSKSDKDQSLSLYMTESPESIAKKIRKAQTDSIQGKIYFDPENRPGVSNLINIISGLTQKSIDDTVKDLEWIQDHKQLKDHVTDLIVEEFSESRHTFNQLMGDLAHIDRICQQGTEKARAIASQNIRDIKKLTGLD